MNSLMEVLSELLCLATNWQPPSTASTRQATVCWDSVTVSFLSFFFVLFCFVQFITPEGDRPSNTTGTVTCTEHSCLAGHAEHTHTHTNMHKGEYIRSLIATKVRVAGKEYIEVIIISEKVFAYIN